MFGPRFARAEPRQLQLWLAAPRLTPTPLPLRPRLDLKRPPLLAEFFFPFGATNATFSAAARQQPSLNSRLEYKPNFDSGPTLPAQLP
jgi:hypothetical protein